MFEILLTIYIAVAILIWIGVSAFAAKHGSKDLGGEFELVLTSVVCGAIWPLGIVVAAFGAIVFAPFFLAGLYFKRKKRNPHA